MNVWIDYRPLFLIFRYMATVFIVKGFLLKLESYILLVKHVESSLMFYFLKYVLNLVDVPSGHDLPSYYPRDDDRGAPRGMRDTDSINASYDRYLRSVVLSLVLMCLILV